MIHIFVGTKAQFIKMMPVMQALNKRSISYNFIDAGQHAGLTGELIRQFKLQGPDTFIRAKKNNISTMNQAISWTISNIIHITFNRKAVFKQVFKGKTGVCLIHGDTLTTIISMFYARRCGIKVAHVESGLRSFNFFDPFPEEIFRLIAMRFSNILFAPSKWAFQNLCMLGYRSKAINIGANTGQDAVHYAINQNKKKEEFEDKPFVVVTIHRMETIYSKERLMMITNLVERIVKDKKVLFFLHEPTQSQLRKFGLLRKLTMLEGLNLFSLKPYLKFVGLLNNAEYVITDGGSIQEECYYLDKPCLVMRLKTERNEGIGENIYLSKFNQNRIDHFLQIFPGLRRKEPFENLRPSDMIVDHLLQWR